jgi:phosphoglycerate dehydrogenase-like enzyme
VLALVEPGDRVAKTGWTTQGGSAKYALYFPCSPSVGTFAPPPSDVPGLRVEVSDRAPCATPVRARVGGAGTGLTPLDQGLPCCLTSRETAAYLVDKIPVDVGKRRGHVVMAAVREAHGLIRVLNFYPFDPSALAKWASVSTRIRIETRKVEFDSPAAVERLHEPEVEIVVGDWVPSDPARMPKLRWLATVGAGVEYLAGSGLAERGVTVTNGSGVHACQIGEYCLGAILSIDQRHELRSDLQRRRSWERESATGDRLRGKTLAVVGYGSIGREVARLAAAFGLRVIAVKARPSIRNDEGFREPGTGDPTGEIPERIVGVNELPAAVSEADFVVLSLPLTAETRGLIGRRELAAFKPTAWIVNVGRGPLIDRAALIESLRSGRLGGAYLDVFDEEPLPIEDPLWGMPNVVVSPHVAGLAGNLESLWTGMAILTEANLRRFVAGSPLVNVVDLARGY